MPGSRPELPFLRAPRFPNVPPATASVTDGRVLAPRPVTDDVRNCLVRARVGGTFWGEAVAVPDSATLVRSGGITKVENGSALPSDCDPWTALEGVGRLVGDDGDDWTIVAGLLGVEVVGHGGHACPPGTVAALMQSAIGGWAYRDPFDGDAATIDATITLLDLWRRTFEANRRIVAVAGIRRWKRQAIDTFFFDGRRPARVVPMAEAIALAKEATGAVAYWPSRVDDADVCAAVAAGVPLMSVEDGFVRSSGLGSNLTPPASIVVDAGGIHYDPGASSDLEQLLQNAVFDDALVDRARSLVERLTKAAVGKYGRQAKVERTSGSDAAPYVLVIGQVDDDQSVLRGRSETVGGNRDLLRAVRAQVGDAVIVYRPHPDVDAGHRDGGLTDVEALTLADRIERGGDLFASMANAAQVHVLTSLAGFEALVRGHHVVVHGRPFYAGWGLTEDRAGAFERRTRRLSVAELVAGTLIRYPRYIDPLTKLPCPVETVIDRLAVGASPTILTRLRQTQGRVRTRLARAMAG